MLKDKQRILIIGNGGAGKSTFSVFLGSKLDLPVYHLDTLFWKPGWQKTETNEWTEINRSLIANDRWIIEGNYTRTFGLRAARADLIYFFDCSRLLCLYGIYKRALSGKFTKEKRADLAEGCKERFPDREFVRFVWRYNKAIRPKMYAVLDEMNFDKSNLIVFKNRRDLKNYTAIL